MFTRGTRFLTHCHITISRGFRKSNGPTRFVEAWELDLGSLSDHLGRRLCAPSLVPVIPSGPVASMASMAFPASCGYPMASASQANLLTGQSVPLSHWLPVCCSPVVAWRKEYRQDSMMFNGSLLKCNEETKQETSLTSEDLRSPSH